VNRRSKPRQVNHGYVRFFVTPISLQSLRIISASDQLKDTMSGILTLQQATKAQRGE